MHTKPALTMTHSCLPWLASLVLAGSPLTASAAPWSMQQMLTAPAEAGYTGDEKVGFGHELALGGRWLAAGAYSGYCVTPIGNTEGGSVLMYRYSSTSQSFEFVQEICGSGRGESMAIWDDWLLLGYPHQDNSPGDGVHNGRVSFLRWDESIGQWLVVQTADGAADSLMGHSVAMENGVAVAGEPGYRDGRGRVRSWRLSADGQRWVDEGWVNGPPPPTELEEGFGSALDIDIRHCRAPSCRRPLDALVVVSRSALYSFERLANGWAPPVTIDPVAGTAAAFNAVAINESLVVTPALMEADDPLAPCAVTTWSSEVRVLARQPGSVGLQDQGFACRDQLGLTPTQQFVGKVALSPREAEFHFSIPDAPAVMLGVVSSWNAGPGGTGLLPADVIVDPDLTTVTYTNTQDGLYSPALTGDWFGRGLAVQARRMAIGAPYYNALNTGLGSGYVVIYGR